MPVEKTPGDTVSAATVNRTGSFTFRATRVGADTNLARIIRLVEDANATKAPIARLADKVTNLARIIRLVEDANATKAPIARLADKVAAVFVPAVLAIAALTFAGWLIATGGDVNDALTAAVAVVVISCPCALGLATPVAIMVGTGKGAEMGILFKSAPSWWAPARAPRWASCSRAPRRSRRCAAWAPWSWTRRGPSRGAGPS